jgi:DegV family protein with EDD domain
MADKVAVVTDSVACLPRELVEQYGIKIVPVNLYFGDKVYRDWVDITPSEAYQLFLKDPTAFKTSGINPADCLEAYRQVSNPAANILCVTISAKLSMVYESALEAKKLARDELPRTSVEVVDSRTATAAEGFIALAAARAAAAGKSLAEVFKVAERVRDRVFVVALMDTIRYVYRSGRIPKIAAKAGSMLNIKPVLTISAGAVRFKGAVRNREHGLKRVLKIARDRAGDKLVHMAVMHAYAPEDAEQLKERVAAEFNCAELWVTEFSPVMGYACGTGTLGLAFYPED